jgi:hypothetical protein
VSPLPVPTESVTPVDSLPFSETVVALLPRLPASSVTACVSATSPVFSTVASTDRLSPATTGESVPVILTANCAGSCTVTVVLSVSFALATPAV